MITVEFPPGVESASHRHTADIHSVSRNASAVNPAKLLVLLVKDIGAPPTVPAD